MRSDDQDEHGNRLDEHRVGTDCVDGHRDTADADVSDVGKETSLRNKIVDDDEKEVRDDADDHEGVRQKGEVARGFVHLRVHLEASDVEGAADVARGEENFEVGVKYSAAAGREGGVGLVEAIEVVVEGDDECCEEEENSDTVETAENVFHWGSRENRITDDEHFSGDDD